MNKQIKTLMLGMLAACLLAAQNAHQPILVSPDQLNIASFLPDPPSNDSQQTAAELTELHQIQQTRTPDQIAHAQGDDQEEDIFIYKAVTGEKFVRAALPLTAALSDHLHNDEGVIVGPAKKFFHRPRPFNFDSTMKPVCRTNKDLEDYAYPSGHATTGYLEGFVLAMILPEKREAILKRADDYAQSRLLCGVHYPTDVAASKLVAYAMVGAMLNDMRFRKEFEAAMTETRAALGLSSSIMPFSPAPPSAHTAR